MAKIPRKPPSVADSRDTRSREYFDNDIFDQHRMAGTVTVDIASLDAGAQTAFVVTVNGALPDKQQTVEYGLPSNWNTGLVVGAVFVSAANTVTFVILNPTGSPINMGSAIYSVRVRP